MKKPSAMVVLTLSLTLGLAACGGGGGGGGTAPTAPSLALTLQATKTFRFTWTDVTGETEYRLLEDPDGTSGFTQVVSLAADATTHELIAFLPARINARYLLQACNSAGCSDSLPVTVSGGLVDAVGYFKASNTNANDRFGDSLALSADGTILAVGAVGEDSNATGVNGPQSDNSAANSGAVHVFSRSGATWSQQAYIKASNTDVFDFFGEAVALSADGTTLVVGASGESSNATGVDGPQADNSAANSGAVYVFSRSGATWSQQTYVKASNTDAGDRFGEAVALSADGATLAVGAVGEASNATGIDGLQADNAATQSGAVYVFSRSGTTWSQQAYVKASNTDADDRFGISLALSADGATLAVGAVGEASNATGIDGLQADNAATQSGAVYVFSRSGSAWAQQTYVKASNTGAGDRFGISLALSADGTTLAVGASDEDSSTTGINGLQGDNAAIQSGAVYVFSRSRGAWSQQAYVKASNTDVDDDFGISLALSADGATLAVGARLEDSNALGLNGLEADNTAVNSGAVYVFSRSGAAWTQQAYVKASNTDAGDRFGEAVALSADGATLAVGAVGEASNATGIDGPEADNSEIESGAVYVY